MKRAAALTIAISLLSGCRAPTPSFNIFAPLGSSRVPAPATGSYGAPSNYYPGTGSGYPTTPTITPTPSYGQTSSTGNSTSLSGSGSPERTAGSWQVVSPDNRQTSESATASDVALVSGTTDHPAESSAVTAAAFQAPVRVTSNGREPTVSEQSSSLAGLKPMPVNDATASASSTARSDAQPTPAAEPARFVPPNSAAPLATNAAPDAAGPATPSSPPRPRFSSGIRTTSSSETESDNRLIVAAPTSSSPNDQGWRTRK